MWLQAWLLYQLHDNDNSMDYDEDDVLAMCDVSLEVGVAQV